MQYLGYLVAGLNLLCALGLVAAMLFYITEQETGGTGGWLGRRGRPPHLDEPVRDGNFLRPHHHMVSRRLPRHRFPDSFPVQDVSGRRKRGKRE